MRLVGVAALTAALVFALPSAALATDPPPVTASCNGAACSTGWYTTDVTVAFTINSGTIVSGCAPVTVSVDSTGDPLSAQPKCEVVPSNSTTSTTLYVPIKRDATTPTVSGLSLRAPDVNGWYNHPVQVAAGLGTASVSGATCATVTYSGPDSGSASVTGTCTSGAGLVSAPKTMTIQYDGTPPSISAAPARAADTNGWYNHAVGVAFSGTDGVSGVDSCTSGAYSGPDSGSASVSGSCRDKAGNSAGANFALRYDSTPPSVTGGTPDRAPDANGWYNHHLVVSFAGTDATSGIAACDAPTYDKPNAATETMTGHCRDNAGNVSPPASFAFKFDATPPKLTNLAISSFDRTVALSWKVSADVATVKIVRTGGGSAAAVTVYAGKRETAFSDKRVRNGSRYSYTVTAFDAAGNAAILKGVTTPSSPLLAPREASRIRAGATLRWRAVPKATYYNIQLWLGRKKVLTTWPAGPSFRLPQLPAGRYTWLVWPGIGPRSQHRYGALIGKSTFVVTG